MTWTIGSRAFGMAGRCFAGTALVLVIAACDGGAASGAMTGAASGAAAPDKLQAEKDALLAQQKQNDEAKRRLDQLAEQNAKIDRILIDLSTAKTEAERAPLQKQLDEAQAAKNALMGIKAKPAAPTCKCAPDDPLCSCL